MNNEGWKAYFQFSKKERKAVIILIALITLVAFLPRLLPAKSLKIEALDMPTDSTPLAIAETEKAGEPEISSTILTPFYFDPNTIDEAGLMKMGMRPKLIKTILNYRNKGGRFYDAESLKRIYGLKENEAEALLPFIRIKNEASSSKYIPGKYSSKKFPQHDFNKPLEKPIDINTAPIEEIRRLPGITVSVAYKILKYREVLGGFTQTDQLKKTYGMTDSIFTAIRPFIFISKSTKPVININTASEKQLLAEPAIPPQVAKAIIIYRQQHGPYKNISELRNISFISAELFTQLSSLLVAE